jgi:hypothetical protein
MDCRDTSNDRSVKLDGRIKLGGRTKIESHKKYHTSRIFGGVPPSVPVLDRILSPGIAHCSPFIPFLPQFRKKVLFSHFFYGFLPSE